MAAELRERLIALIEKESHECGLWAAGILDDMASVPGMEKLTGRDALKAAAAAMRNESAKVLVNAPRGSVFVELGKLCAEVEQLRAKVARFRERGII